MGRIYNGLAKELIALARRVGDHETIQHLPHDLHIVIQSNEVCVCLRQRGEETRRERLAALEELTSFDRRDDVLVEAVRGNLTDDDDPAVRAAALRAFSTLAEPTQAIQVMRFYLHNVWGRVRRVAVEELARLSARSGRNTRRAAKRAILARIHDESIDVRLAALRALSSAAELFAGDDEAISEAVAQLKDRRWLIREAALSGLRALVQGNWVFELADFVERAENLEVIMRRVNDPDRHYEDPRPGKALQILAGFAFTQRGLRRYAVRALREIRLDRGII
jgi:hypothetical protein